MLQKNHVTLLCGMSTSEKERDRGVGKRRDEASRSTPCAARAIGEYGFDQWSLDYVQVQTKQNHWLVAGVGSRFRKEYALKIISTALNKRPDISFRLTRDTA